MKVDDSKVHLIRSLAKHIRHTHPFLFVNGLICLLIVLAGCGGSATHRAAVTATPVPKPLLLGELFSGNYMTASSETTTVIAFDPQNGMHKWQVTEPGGPRGMVAVLGDTAYVLSDVSSITHSQNETQFNDSAHLTALDAATGAVRWQQSVPSGQPVLVGAAGTSVLTEQYIYSTQTRQFTDQLTAFATTSGAVQWTKRYTTGVQVAPFAVSADAFYVCTHEGASDVNTLSALRLSDGSPIWTVAQGLNNLSYLGLADNGVLYFGQNIQITAAGTQASATVFAFNASTGQKLWQSGRLPGLFLYPVTVSGTTLFVLATSGYGASIKRSVLAFNAASGQKQWQSATDPYIANEAFTPGLHFGVADSTHLYYSVERSPSFGVTPPPGTSDAVIALDTTTGTQAWKMAFPQPVSQPTLFDGTLYVWSQALASGTTITSGSLLALDPATGAVRWQVTLPGEGYYPLTATSE